MSEQPSMPSVGPSGPGAVSPLRQACGYPHQHGPHQGCGGIPLPPLEAQTTFVGSVHLAVIRQGLWAPWCAGVGWCAPLTRQAEQVTCPLCQQQVGTVDEQQPEPPPVPADVLMHLGSHWCTSRTERDGDVASLAGLVRWYPADQPCPTSAARGGA